MRICLLFIVSFLFLGTVSAQETFSEIDLKVDSLPVDIESPTALANELAKFCQTDLEKTRATYYWIAKNIRYDYEGLKSNYWDKVPSYKALIILTFKKKKGICAGYSHLFKTILDLLEVECEVIEGNAKGSAAYDSGEFVNHAWNAVKLDSTWHLLDVTWASPKKRSGKVSDFYFLTAPDKFIVNHFPEKPTWTLLDRAVSREEYEQFPKLTEEFYTEGLALKKYTLAEDSRSINLELFIPEKIRIDFTIRNQVTKRSGPLEFESEDLGEGIQRITLSIPDDIEEYKIEMNTLSIETGWGWYGVLKIN